MKARINYSSGWQLIIPKTGLAPMLFLEWLSENRAGLAIIHKVINDTDGVESGFFRIRMNVLKESYTDARNYINLNL